MIIPHISIVSGLLLAGNNPNPLEGVIARELGDLEEEPSFERKHFGPMLFELAYDSRYRPQWLWLRGNSKQDWVKKVWTTYRPRAGRQGDPALDKDMVGLRKATTLSAMDWMVTVVIAVLLMSVPFLLAFITGFYTPEVGISCRALTLTVYAIAQMLQIVLWLWA